MVELVRCKSRAEEGVREALPECARRYLEPTLAPAGAKAIVCLGGHVREALAAINGFTVSSDIQGPVAIGGLARFFIFLPHPNARGKRSFVASPCYT